MAEVVVPTTVAISQLILSLADKLNLSTVVVRKGDIQNMKSWLTSFQALLMEAINYHGRENEICIPNINQFQKVVHDIEDVLDHYSLHSSPYTYHRYKISRHIHTQAHHLRNRYPHRDLSKKIQTISKEIQRMTQVKALSRCNCFSFPWRSTSCRVSPLLHDNDMLGHEKDKTQFTNMLVKGEKMLLRLAVDGPPGSGKTTFIDNIFSKRVVKAQYDCRAWVRVSDHLKPDGSGVDADKMSRNLLQQLCSSRNEPCPPEDGSNSMRRLQKYLDGKSYLVVLDDVWRIEECSCLKDALPESNRRSRIVITTRSSRVSSDFATSPHRDHIYKLDGLQAPDAWKLFCRKAFPATRECPSELEDVSSKILTICEGMPLAIVAVAAALASKQKTQHEWESFHSNLASEMMTNIELSPIKEELLSSYMHLSSSLKLCLLYMSVFPEDHSVQRGRLIRLWVAEGFAIADDNHTAEEVAEDHLNELIHRNLIHVTNYRPRKCRVRKLLHMFIVQKSKDGRFASAFPKEINADRNQKIEDDQIPTSRRLWIHDHCKPPPQNTNLAAVRSMFFLRPRLQLLENILPELELIKVLEVENDQSLTEFPKVIKGFTLMRYLSLRNTKIMSIPSSIEKLCYLETLDLKRTLVTELPRQITNLRSLRHLFVYKGNGDSVQGVKFPEGMRNLTQLQSLTLVEVGTDGRILKELKALTTQLRKLGLTGIRRQHGDDLCAAIEMMKNLKTLEITSAENGRELIDVMDEMKNPPKKLERLYLKGFLEKIPNWMSQLHDMVRIDLKWCRLRESPLETLKGLQKLRELHMVDCFESSVEELVFEASGFKKLELLVMEYLRVVKMVRINEDGGMGELKKISLTGCTMMKLRGVLSHIELAVDEKVGPRRSRSNDGEQDRSFIPSLSNSSR